jgi:3-oxoacyl-(acyl-carrier-protein) synthase
MPIRRTTLAAERDDLSLLEAEARRRGVSLARLLREVVAREAADLRRRQRPRLGIVQGEGSATKLLSEDEHAPARSAPRS